MMLMAVAAIVATQAQTTKTVKVIDHPTQVIITESAKQVQLDIKGDGKDTTYRYQLNVKPGKDRLETTQSEGSGDNFQFNFPFKRRSGGCDVDDSQPHWETVCGDAYVGWGSATVDPSMRDQIKKTDWEIGVLNVLGVGYVFNQSRSRLSLGVGFNWSHYGLKKPYFWTRDTDGVTGYETNEMDYDKHHASLLVRSLQVPLMFSQSLGRHWAFSVGGIFNWNCYASYGNHYRIDKSDYKVNTRGLHQRKASFDVIGIVNYHSLGAYFRFAPQSVFEKDKGPEIKNRWTVGVILTSW